jgi:hypothetical protein
MGTQPPGSTIERKNNTKGYFPQNCRWATPAEQARNKSTTVRVTYQGITLCVSEWGRRSGVGEETLRARLKRGWSVRKALTEQVRGR